MIGRILLASIAGSSLYATCPSVDNLFQLQPQTTAQPIAQPIVYENRFVLEADFIYWFAKQEGNNYATTGSAITVPGTTDPNTGLTPGTLQGTGSVYSPNSQMNPGFKVGIGTDLAHDQWDLLLEYTYLHAHANGSVSSNNLNAGILPIFGGTPNNSILGQATYAGGDTGYISRASSKWSIHFNNFDWIMGKNLQLSPNFNLRPNFGLKGTWQQQTFDANYLVTAFSDFVTNLGQNHVRFKQDFWGLGIRAGLDSTWNCCNHFGIFANSGIAALWGRFRTVGTSLDTNNNAGYTNVYISNQANTLHTLSPVLELSAGLQFDWTCTSGSRFVAQAGWEEQVWFFQNQHSSAIADLSLVLQGLTLKFRFDF